MLSPILTDTPPLRLGAPNVGRLQPARKRAEATGFSRWWVHWGKTLEECRRSGDFKDAVFRQWLEFFVAEGPAFRKNLR